MLPIRGLCGCCSAAAALCRFVPIVQIQVPVAEKIAPEILSLSRSTRNFWRRQDAAQVSLGPICVGKAHAHGVGEKERHEQRGPAFEGRCQP